MKHFLKGIGALALAIPAGAFAQEVAPEPRLQDGEGPMPSEIVRGGESRLPLHGC